MNRTIFMAALLAAFGASSAIAAPTASTSKKGSVLIFPYISVDPSARAETLIEISNDASATVHVECNYMNEWKGRVDFDFDLTGKATASWTVGSMAGDLVNPPQFPEGGSYRNLGSRYRGELVCFATDANLNNQISWNHLHGNATVHINASQFKYNPWAFQALDAAGAPNGANGAPVGTPGKIDLTGAPSAYDACPAYNVTTFMPNGAQLGDVRSINNSYAFASCNQDLRQDYRVHLTKLQYEKVWNSREQGFSHAYQCSDSVGTSWLSRANTRLYNGSNFDYSTLRTPNARFQVQGVQSTQCPGSENAGLLGVVWSTVSRNGAVGVSGTTMHGAGWTPGYIYWDKRTGPTPLRAK